VYILKSFIKLENCKNLKKRMHANGTAVLMEIYEDIPDILTHAVNLKRNLLRVQKRR